MNSRFYRFLAVLVLIAGITFDILAGFILDKSILFTILGFVCFALAIVLFVISVYVMKGEVRSRHRSSGHNHYQSLQDNNDADDDDDDKD